MPDAVYKLRAPSKEPKLNFGILIREKEERERRKEMSESGKLKKLLKVK